MEMIRSVGTDRSRNFDNRKSVDSIPADESCTKFESQTNERRLSRRKPILDNKYSINFLKAKNKLNCC